MRSVLVLGLLIALCASANAATVHRSKPPRIVAERIANLWMLNSDARPGVPIAGHRHGVAARPGTSPCDHKPDHPDRAYRQQRCAVRISARYH